MPWLGDYSMQARALQLTKVIEEMVVMPRSLATRNLLFAGIGRSQAPALRFAHRGNGKA
jgi:hypothetical protein